MDMRQQVMEFIAEGLITFDGTTISSDMFSDEELMIMMEVLLVEDVMELDDNGVPPILFNDEPTPVNGGGFDWDNFLIFLEYQIKLGRGRQFLYSPQCREFVQSRIDKWIESSSTWTAQVVCLAETDDISWKAAAIKLRWMYLKGDIDYMWNKWRELKAEMQEIATPAFWARLYDMFGRTHYKVLRRKDIPINGNRLRFDKWDRLDIDAMENYLSAALRSTLDPYWSWSDSEAIDRQETYDPIGDMRNSHITEENKCNREVFDNWQPKVVQRHMDEEEWAGLLS